MKKKLLAMLLAVLMVVSLLPTAAFAFTPGKGMSAPMWTDTVTCGSYGTLTISAYGAAGQSYPDDAATAGYYYEGMTLVATMSGTYVAAVPAAANEWTVSDGTVYLANGATLISGSTLRVSAHDGSGVAPVTGLAGLWVHSDTVVIPAPTPIPQAATSVSLSSITSPANEYAVVTLTAEVEYDSDGDSTPDADLPALEGGTVTYYANGSAVATVPYGGSYSYQLPAWRSGGVYFSAAYSGTALYAACSTAAATVVLLSSVTLDGSGAALPASSTLTVGTASNLSVGTVKDTADNTLTEGTDYTVKYYVNTGDGVWSEVTSPVTPAAGYTYKAVVTPAGSYTRGAFELGPIGGSSMTKAATTTAVTKVTTGDIWQARTAVVYKAEVTAAVGGTVDFYLVKGGTETFYASAALVNGAANCSVVFPENGSYNVKAVYSGTGAYETSNGTTSAADTVKSTTLEVTTAKVTPDTLTLGADNTLTLTVEPTSLAEGTDYVVVWQQNNGSGWIEFARGGSTQTVKPMTKDMRYRALLLPAGDYIAPANGIVATPAAASATLLTTATTLAVDDPTPFEDGTITLTAEVKDSASAAVGGGKVLFTLPGSVYHVVAVDSLGQARLTVKAPAAGTAQTYKAQYLGDSVLYAASAEVSTSVTSKAVTIKAASGAILSGGSDYTAVAGTAATLELPAITRDGDTALLTYGTDFVTEWFVSKDGSTWNSLGFGATVTVTPEAVTWKYMAVATPVGDYKKPYGGLVFASAGGSLTVTTTELAVSPPTTIYKGNSVTVTATVKAGGTAITDGTDGKVYFINDATGAQLAVQTLGADGKAAYTFTAKDTLKIRAEFSGTGKYKASVAGAVNVAPQNPQIKTASDSTAFTISPSTAPDQMVVGTEYTITLPEIQDANTSTALTLNTHYTVQWKSLNADGSWSDIGSSTSSITVTPGHDGAAYTAIVSPNYNEALDSYYVLPAGGISMDTVSTGVKKDSTVTVTVDGSVTEAFEGSTVRVVATVEDTAVNPVNGGSVRFFANSAVLSPDVAVVNGVAAYDYVMPAWSTTANTYKFTAVYSGTNAYKAASDTTGKTVTDKSATLTSSADIVIKDSADVVVTAPVVGTAYKLTAPAVYAKDDLSNALTLGTHYTLEWQYAENGNEWITVTGSGSVLTNAVFGNNNSAYRVIIRPEVGSNYTMPSSIVKLCAPKAAAKTTTTVLAADKTEYFEGTQAILTATVTASATDFAVGTVEFYLKGSSDVLLGYGDLDSMGKARLTVTVPAYASGTPTAQYYAKYLGCEVYATSTSADQAVAVKSTGIYVASKTLTTASVQVGNTYTLTIPAVTRFGTGTALVIGTDYAVTWQISTDNGASWSNLDNPDASSISVTPADKNTQYRAIVTPKGDYTKSYDGTTSPTTPSSYLTMNVVSCTVIVTTTTLTVTDTAGVYGSESIESEYEGETVTLTAKATYNNGSSDVPVKSGYFYFYRNGVKLNAVGAAVDAAGVAQYTAVMSSYNTAETLANNKDVFTAEFVANDSYATSDESKPVGIRSTAIAVPTVTSSVGGTGGSKSTTTSAGLDGLPTSTKMVFTANAVTAKDGRALTAGADYTFQWQKQEGGYMVAIPGAEASTYEVPVPYGSDGDSWRLVLMPAGHMRTGNESYYLTVGTKLTPSITLTFTMPYAAGGGSHVGDEVILTAEVERGSGSARPTGYVEFWCNNNGTDTKIGTMDLAPKSGTPGTAMATWSTKDLPHNNAGTLELYVKYFGDANYTQRTTSETAYKVWATTLDENSLSVSAKDADGNKVTGALTAAQTYTLTLADTVKTEDGEALTFASGKYTIEWQQSTNGVDWVKVPSATKSLDAQVTPATEAVRYRAQVTTTYKFLAEPYNTTPTRYDTKESNVINAQRQDVTVVLSSADTVYAGNAIRLTAEITPDASTSTEDPTGTVLFYYRTPGGVKTPVASTDAMGSNNAAVLKYLYAGKAHFYAAITVTELPAKTDDGKQQPVTIYAEYQGDSTYHAGSGQKTVQVYSSTLYVDNTNVAGKVIGDPVTSTDGIIIYAPENVLKADGAPTVLTLKPLYTNDKENAAGTGIDSSVGDHADLTKDVNYTIQWQVSKDNGSTWANIDGQTNNFVTVEPLANYAYRAVITAIVTAERTVKSQTTYYSNILKAESADAVLQMRMTPASSAAYSDTDITVDTYASGGSTEPSGEVTLTIRNGGTVVSTCTLDTVSGHVTFGTALTGVNPKINLPAGVYTVRAEFRAQNGYVTETAEETYIVRYRSGEVKVELTPTAFAGLIYSGESQRPDAATVTFTPAPGHAAAQALADESVVFLYQMKAADGTWGYVDAPFDAGDYRVCAYLPESIYYEASAKTDWLEFTVARKDVSVSDILVQSKVYDGTTDVNLLEAELTGVVAGDSVYAVGTAKLTSAEALVANQVTFTAAELKGADKDNYQFADDTAKVCAEAFTVQRSQIVVNSGSVTDKYLNGLQVWDAYGKTMSKGSGYTVRTFLHDGTGVKETAVLKNDSKYTVVIAPVDTANYKGGASFVMKLDATGTASFEGKAAANQPGIVSITGTQKDWAVDAAAVVTVSNSAAVTETYNAAVVKAGRYGLKVTGTDVAEANGILNVYKIEADHVKPVVADKVYDGIAVVPAAEPGKTFPTGTYFTYTGGEIPGVSYDAPKDVGEYTVTAHVPATETTVAYAETSTFKISQREITIEAVKLEKQLYLTNPELRVTYVGLVDGDSVLDCFIALPSFSTPKTNDGNLDLNNVGEFVYAPYGAISRNYKVREYVSNSLFVKAEDPQVAMQIVGVPACGGTTKTVYFGSAFRLSVYGTQGKRVAEPTETRNNPSSYILWGIKESGESDWHWASASTPGTSVHGYTIDKDGNVSTAGATAAGVTIQIRGTRGTGDYKVFAETEFQVAKAQFNICMSGADRKVFNGAAQTPDSAKYRIVGASGAYTLVFNPANETNVGEYLITATYSDALRSATGTGLMTITPKAATVTAGSPTAVYGTLMTSAGYTPTDNCYSDTLLTGGTSVSDVRASSDVGSYEWFAYGVEDANYDITYVSGTGTVTAKALAVKVGVDGATANTITEQVKREYGEVNPVLGYHTDGLIAGDSLADLVIADKFVTYERSQEDNANLAGNDNVLTALGKVFVNEHTDSDNYGKIDLADTLANINASAANYTITGTDGTLDIFQKRITVTPFDLSVLTGDVVEQSSHNAKVVEVLTDSPMNDTLADLKLVYTPEGTAGTDFTVNQTITVSLTAGTAADPQNYFRTNTDTATLYVDGNVSNVTIGATTSAVNVDTKHGVTYLPVYQWVDANTDGVMDDTELTATSWYVLNSANAWDADTKNNPVAVDNAGSFETKYAFYDGNSNEQLAKDAVITGAADANYYVKKDDTAAKVNAEAVNVGDFTYTVLDQNGKVVAEGTMSDSTDPTKVGTYTGAATLPYGSYTVVLGLPSGGSYILNKNVGKVTLSAPYTPSKPALETKNHFGYIAGYPDGTFLPNGTITRAEAAMIFYRLLVDKSYVGTKDFTDVEAGFWAYDAIQALAYNDVIVGYPDGSFKPNGKITRAEFCAIASRFFDMKAGNVSFTDVPETHWAFEYIASAAKYGWIEDGATEFRPNDNITRADAVVIVNNMLGRKADQAYVNGSLSAVFSDVDATNPAFYAIMEAAVGHEYTKDSKGVETWIALQ